MTLPAAFPLPAIPDLTDADLQAQLQAIIDQKTKPLGALGQLEALMLRVGLILGSQQPLLHQPQMLVCAADHGLAAQGVSAYPSDVTWQMVENFLAGGAAVSVLARQHGLALTVADCGVAREIAPRPATGAAPQLRHCRLGAGTRDASQGPAMTLAQCQQALANGMALVDSLPGNVLLLGEMGIGNTSAAALLLARLTGTPLADCVGRGTGLDDAGLVRKQAVLAQALQANAQAHTPLEVLAALGGFEIATLTGAVLQAASQRRVIVVDGFITSAAVLVAARLAPAVLQRCVFSHHSQERGHAAMLTALQAQPLLDLDLRLGEGSGAALAWPLLDSATRILREMASFASAGVSQQGA